MKPRTIFIIAALAVVLTLCVLALPMLADSTPRDATIRIPRGADKAMISDTLTKYCGEDFARRTMRLIPTDKERLAARYGAYRIEQGDSPLTVARRISRGAQTSFDITVNGVRQLDTFLPRIAAKFDFSAEQLSAALQDPAVMRRHGITDPRQWPALFLNDTYSFFWTATPTEVIDKIADNYHRFWTAERTAQASTLGLTPLEMTTVASIVDEETNRADEKGRIGRLYINRLQRGMRLQADPTVRFALGDFTIKRVSGKHLQADSPYNTYRIQGLPPGPIRTTSKATLLAILDSSPSSDIYMCASPDFSGHHIFADSYEEHMRNARKYQAALDSLGIGL